MKNLAKILTALAAVAGVVYMIATYGEQIVAWAKKVLNMLPKCPSCEEVVEAEVTEEEAAAETAEEAVAEEVPVEEAVEEAPEVIVTENDSVAAEEDFAE